MEKFGQGERPGLVAETEWFCVWQVRWPVLEGLWGEGLLVEPTSGVPGHEEHDRLATELPGLHVHPAQVRNSPSPRFLVALPDADETPEQVLGLGVDQLLIDQTSGRREARKMKTAPFHRFVIPLAALLLSSPGFAEPARQRRQDWYWDSIVNLHIDNHSLLAGQGKSVEELAALLKDLPVDMIQVSAYGNQGDAITYQSEILDALEQQPEQGEWDTLAAWGDAARSLGKRFHVYINTRGMKVHTLHPEYMQQDARGQGSGRGKGLLDACPRPAPDGDGYLENFLEPLLREIVTKYRPGGIWIDGDHARTQVCYCKNCREAWRRLTGGPLPPKDDSDPGWPAWLALEQERYDEYRRRMAAVIHEANPATMYTSNHSWRKTFGARFEKIDPRSAPEWVDSYSADLSHGNSLRETRLSAMLLSPEEEIPYDIMHLFNRDEKISPARVLQQAAVTLASGGAWFLWMSGDAATDPAAHARARECAEFAQARKEALGRTRSRNPVAVLSSETSWWEERVGGENGFHDFIAANHCALALQDAGYGVDLINERILERRLASYRVVFVPNQRKVAPETFVALGRFARQGGLLVVTGHGLSAHGTEATGLLGLKRENETRNESLVLALGHTETLLESFVPAKPLEAKSRVTHGKDTPILTVKPLGKGRVAYFSGMEIPHPDHDGLLPFLLQKLDAGPLVATHGPMPNPHLVFSLREKENRAVLHVTDLTSHAGDRRVPVDRTDRIDDARPVEKVTMRLAWPHRPAKVEIVPDETSVTWDWADRVLELNLENLRVHAALILDPAPENPPDFLPAATPLATRFPWVHYEDLFTIEDGFEYEDHGHEIGLLARYQVRTDGKTGIRIVTDTAATGRGCVEFLDHSQASQAYFPYFSVTPQGMDRGAWRFSLDMKIGGNAFPAIDFRTVENRRDYPAGPSLHFRDGTVIAPKKGSLCPFPQDRWFRIEIDFVLGTGTYDLALRFPDENPKIFRDLPCWSGAEFRKCGWIGLTGNGVKPASFFIDNLKIERVEPGALSRPH